MLEYWWMANNETGRNHSDEATIEEMLQDPGSVILFVDYSRWLLCFAAACCILFMLVGIPGNLITVIALFRTKKLRNATAVFIMNLSISDLMFCCFNLPLATSTFWHRSWLHGPLLCRLFPLLRYGLVAVSLFSVLAITINRYVMIGHPGLYPTLYKTRYLIPMVLAIWIIAFGLLIVTWFERFGRFGLDPVVGSCSILPDVNGRSPKEFLFVLAFLIPCLAIIVCYARIFYIVRETASKSRGRDKIFNIEPAEISNDQPSTRNQERELSVFSAPSSSMQMGLLNPDEGMDLELPSTSANEDSWSKQSIQDQQETNFTTRLQIDDPTTNLDIRSNSNVDSGCDVPHISLSEDFSFVDDCEIEKTDFAETGLFLNRDQREPQRKLSENSCDRSAKSTDRASLVMGSQGSLQRLPGERSDRSNSKSPERSCARRAFRRQSKFKSIGNVRNGGDYSAPRMSAKDRKLLQMILVIFASFLVCYLPITVTKLFQNTVNWRGFNIAGYILIYLTTCINPVIYVVMSSEYRSAYKYVLLCKREQGTNKRRLPG
ncbi:G-protein coupled receptor moody [Pogonomyrmex barbatus]|uniref:G-protein coupled receptor moody n=1 Tax=Pogonomyrmex barbatus TaxID=144034 RepID=A0A6I9WUN5_9HYME|nr:G-protein coupled receptor moody [Pogonomyrmex barbatus]